METEVAKYDEDYQFNNLANIYNKKKKESILNIIECGKILSEAKQELPHGRFQAWLADTRVQESVKTAQRLMQIFANFRHLLTLNFDQLESINNLGMMKLLTLTELPDRFHKQIEIDGNGNMADVIDEQKLADFLDKAVVVNGEVKQVKNLSLPDFRKQIIEESGDYSRVQEKVGDVEENRDSDINILTVPNPPNTISALSSILQDNIDYVANIDDTKIFEMTEDMKKELKDILVHNKGLLEALIVRINDAVVKL